VSNAATAGAADILQWIGDAPVLDALRSRVREGGTVRVAGTAGSSASVLALMLISDLLTSGRSVLIVCAHLDEAEQVAAELESCGVDAQVLAAMEIMPGETSVRLDLVAERLVLLRELVSQPGPMVVVASISALMQGLPAAEVMETLVRTIRCGQQLDPQEFASWLIAAGYERTQAVETPGEFSVRGGIIDVFPPGGEAFRIDLFGEEVEGIFAMDVASMASDRRLDKVDVIGGMPAAEVVRLGKTILSDHLPAGSVAMLFEPAEIVEQGRAYYDRVLDAQSISGPPAVLASIERASAAVVHMGRFTGAAAGDVTLSIESLPIFPEESSHAIRELCRMACDTCEAVLLVRNAGEAQRAAELIESAGGNVPVRVMTLDRGFIWTREDGSSRMLVPYHELLHRWNMVRRKRRMTGDRAIDAFTALQAGDFVVHRDHGIAKFLALRTIDDNGEEYLVLEFAKGSRLNVPASRIDAVQRYVGASGGKPELSVMGGRRWKVQKERAADAVAELAAEMLRVQAVRASMPGIRFPADTPWQREFEAEFPWDETEDQVSAIAAVKRDMESARPMDRLICGDVGFGKTEVAIRAAFKAVECGRQVAILVPTTILAEQHERTFRARFAGYPFHVAGLSRFRSRAEVRRILDETASGRIDVVVGTHRLLGADVVFRDLGLVIIDEEQRFGVEHKQKLLSLRATADVLTLTATPIPRTLHMAMLGLRDISSLTTPPADRRAIVTDVIPWNPQRVRMILERELAREGQVFYVHNRVHDIQSVAAEVASLVPDARILVGHGRMRSGELERVMLAFVRGEADILVSTTIIESGLDIPRANTMIIHDADMFGLAELHQLRGRVGRFRHRAYCYLILPRNRTVSDVARRRLEALESFSMLGSGFRIALRDLELRGAGNLLGAEQSGHISAVGYEMYCRLLEEAVERLRTGSAVRSLDAQIDLGFGGLIPRGYLPIDGRRMDAYRRLSQATDQEALDRLRKDLVDAYGPLPRRVEVLFDLAEIRLHAAAAGIRRIVVEDRDVVYVVSDPAALERRFAGMRGPMRVVGEPDAEGCVHVYHRPPPRYMEPDSLRTWLRRRLAGRDDPS